MNFIALGFALPAAFHNPWLHGAALVVLLVCLPRLLGIVYIPHTQVGIIEKIWSSKGSDAGRKFGVRRFDYDAPISIVANYSHELLEAIKNADYRGR